MRAQGVAYPCKWAPQPRAPGVPTHDLVPRPVFVPRPVRKGTAQVSAAHSPPFQQLLPRIPWPGPATRAPHSATAPGKYPGQTMPLHWGLPKGDPSH